MGPLLLAHWPLAEDARDVVGDCHGVSTDATFGVAGPRGQGATRFNGASSVIEVAHQGVLALGRDDFTLTLWARPAAPLADTVGDLLSKWDPAARCGLNLGFLHHAGVTCAQPNGRQLYAGIDSGTEPQWENLGRPGRAVYVMGLCSHAGELFAATYEAGEQEVGHVYRLARGGWEDCGFPGGANGVAGLAVFEGKLYAGSMRYNASGSALGESANEVPGGRVYRYEGPGEWVDCGGLPEAAEVLCLCVWRDQLYAIPLYSPGVFRYEGGTTWADCGVPGNRRAFALGVHHGDLYVASNAGPADAPRETWRSAVFRYAGGRDWVDCGPQGENTQTYSLVTYRGALHAGTWPDGSVWRHEADGDWRHAGRLGGEREVMPMMVYNGKLYAGTLPLAQVYRHEDEGRWSLLKRLDQTPAVTYRRVWSMAIHDGRLICGTLPSGEVHAMATGACVTAADELPAEWRHIAVRRRGEELALFVDGQQVGQGTGAALDLANQAPLRLGFGEHDHLAGDLADVQLYQGALDDGELGGLAAK